MKIHRFILSAELQPGSLRITDSELVRQMREVLRFTVAQELMISDGKGMEASAHITAMHDDAIEIEVGQPTASTREAARAVVLFCAILKRENFELVAQKAVEVGVTEIVPVITSRTIKKGLRMDRLHKIMKEAAEQSGRAVIPKLHEAIDFAAALTRSSNCEARILCDETGEKLDTTSLYEKNSVALFIGPEGGFSPEEVETAGKSGLAIVSLGKTTLRAETAAIVGSYISCND